MVQVLNRCRVIESVLLRRPKASIDCPTRPKEFGDKLARHIVSEDNPVFADTKAPESRKIFIKGLHIPLLARVHFVKSTANVPPNARMKRLEGADNLV